mgnify:CR=1 FL=1
MTEKNEKLTVSIELMLPWAFFGGIPYPMTPPEVFLGLLGMVAAALSLWGLLEFEPWLLTEGYPPLPPGTPLGWFTALF